MNYNYIGIKYSAQIIEGGYTPKEILKIAQLPESYQTEISKGMRLAKYVEVK